MKNLFRLLTIKSKLMLIIVIAVGTVIIAQALSLNELWNNLNSNKREELRHIIEVAYSVIEQQDRLVNNGQITLETAKENARRQISTLSYGKNEYFFIFDSQYNMVMHPVKPSLEKSSQELLVDSNGFMFFKSMVDSAVASGDSYVDYVWPRSGETEPVRKTSYGRYFSSWNWGVASGLYTDDITSLYWAEFKSAATSTLLIVVVLSYVVFLAARSIVKPLKYLENKIVKISQTKDLTIRSTLQGRDELADISLAVNLMLDSFHNTLVDMSLAAEQVASASTELSATTNQTMSGMDTQKSETQQVASAMMQMATTVQEVAQNTSDAAKASHGASEASDAGKAVILTTKNSVKELTGKLERAEVLTNHLEGQAANISSILAVITSIAEQTNLLALNAAIEAARAGEQGRGFAVVADEVRSLSSRTHESTNEIHQVITELQSGSKAAVKVMSESKRAADLVENKAIETEQAFVEITNAVEEIDAMTNQIATASEEQTAVAEEINRNINNISIISEESATGAQQTAMASEELAQLAITMKGDIQQFTLNT